LALYILFCVTADLSSRTFPALTRLAIDLESCSNPLKNRKSPNFDLCSGVFENLTP